MNIADIMSQRIEKLLEEHTALDAANRFHLAQLIMDSTALLTYIEQSDSAIVANGKLAVANEKLINELNEARAEISEWEDAVSELEDDHANAEARVEELEGQLDEAEREVAGLRLRLQMESEL